MNEQAVGHQVPPALSGNLEGDVLSASPQLPKTELILGATPHFSSLGSRLSLRLWF